MKTSNHYIVTFIKANGHIDQQSVRAFDENHVHRMMDPLKIIEIRLHTNRDVKESFNLNH